jgi:hypothetical protein
MSLVGTLRRFAMPRNFDRNRSIADIDEVAAWMPDVVNVHDLFGVKTDSPVGQNQLDIFRHLLAHQALKARTPRARKNEIRKPIQLRGLVQSPREKYFASVFQKSVIRSRHPVPQEGRFAIVTNVGCGMRWTRQRRVRSWSQGEPAS